MVTDRQVRLLRKKRMEEKTLEAAAVAAGMSERTARTWQHGPLPSATTTSRSWRTRPDPFVDVWAAKIEPLLVADSDGKLEAKTIFEELCRLQPDAFEPGQLRTLQRRVRVWRAERGPEKEIFFPQLHTAGKMGAIDFTHATELSVIIGGLPFVHLFFELVFAFSGWRFVQLAFGETFEALLGGVQAALWALGGVPETIRLDNLSAATHELARTGGRSLTKRFADVVEHYGFKASRIRPGEGHENGVVEQGHHRLKSALDQALRLRGSREFGTVPEYLTFVQRIVDVQLNGGREARAGPRCSPTTAGGATAGVHAHHGSRAEVEHRDRGEAHLLGALAADRAPRRAARARQRHRGSRRRQDRRDDATCPRRGRTSHRLPARNLVAGPQARRVRGLSVPRRPLPVAHVSACVRRAS